MKRHLNILISGKVQGVGFRQEAKKFAQQYYINGFIENNTDGTVCIEAESEEYYLNKFLEWCQRGPKSAVVTNVKVVQDKIKDYTAFEIRQ